MLGWSNFLLRRQENCSFLNEFLCSSFLCGWNQFLLSKKGNLTAYFDFLGTANASEFPFDLLTRWTTNEAV